jgi:hypothetical protein
MSVGPGCDLSNITNITVCTEHGLSRTNGAIGGAQAGYNWQTGDWVFGPETDIVGYDAR